MKGATKCTAWKDAKGGLHETREGALVASLEHDLTLKIKDVHIATDIRKHRDAAWASLHDYFMELNEEEV